jgi:putative ABC transport system permease protein
MERDLPEIEAAIRMMMIGGTWMRYEDKGFGQMFCVADPRILSMFDFPLIRGNPETALQTRFSVLITEEAAQKFFGKEDPVGKVITAEGRYFGGDYLITGVLKNMPNNSSLRFDFLSATMHQEIPLLAWEQWQPDTSWRPVQTYVLLKPNSSVAKLEQKLQELMAQYMGEEIRAYNTYYLQPLTRIHLYSEADYGFHGGGDITQVYIFSSIAFFILLIACINFVNLTTARSINRAREVGLRKVVGASRSQLAGQFLGESIFLVFLSLILAMGFAELALPVMNNLTGNRLSLETLQTGQIVATLLGMGVLIGFLSGCYPALFVSSFQPITALKGQQKTGKTGNMLRKGLVICQFAISIVLITGTVIIYQQLGYMQNKKLGFNKDQIVVLPLFNIDRSLTTHYETVKQAFLEHPNVLKASASNATIAWFGEALQTVHPEGVANDEWQMRILGVDEDFLTTYEIEIAEGRRFSKNIPTDATEAYILNEAAVKQLGWTDPIGKSFEWAFWNRMRCVTNKNDRQSPIIEAQQARREHT